jgi:holin-like protein
MLEARQHHRQLRAKPRGAVAPRHHLEHRRPAATSVRRSATATEAVRQVVVKALQLLAFVALSQLGYRLASWLALPVPGSVVAVGMLFSLLSGRLMPARWAERLAAMLLKYLAVCIILVAVCILAFGDPLTTRTLAIALTLLGSAIVGLAIACRARRFRPDIRMRVLASLVRTARSAVGSIQSFVIPVRLSPSDASLA